MGHFFILPAAVFRAPALKTFFSAAGVAFLGLAFALKPDTYDLLAYLDYFEAPYLADIGFYLITVGLGKIGFAPSGILVFVQTLITATVLLNVRIVSIRRDFFPAFLLVFGSIFFILSSQNVLRQGLSVAIATLAYILLIKKIRGATIPLCLFFISLSVHFWTIILVALMVLELVLNSLDGHSKKNSQYLVLGFLCGLLSLFIIDGLGASDVYLDVNFAWEGGRTSTLLKLSVYILMFGSLHFLAGDIFRSNAFFKRIYSVRVLIFGFSLPLAVYGEIFSRMQVFFYSFESLLLVWLYCSGKSKANVALVIFAVSYAFAPNALNILNGM